ncbi:50S ribosomal protein L29 [Candidatus Uhrbacteria bacterium]|nr:50S ribosomal protein L29 [Candidatus Uhrbacteria bacterium]
MDYQELKNKSAEEARKQLEVTREELRAARFRVRHGEEKDVRRIRELRRLIAQLLTFSHKKDKTPHL